MHTKRNTQRDDHLFLPVPAFLAFSQNSRQSQNMVKCVYYEGGIAMGFRFNHNDQQSVEDIFERLIQPEKINEEQQRDEGEALAGLDLSDDFIKQHTAFQTYAEFVLKAPANLRTFATWSDHDRQRFDRYLAQFTDFASYEELKTALDHH